MLRLNGIKSLTDEARSNVLQAAGYTTRRYVKLLRLLVEAPFPVCSARSSRRQEGVLLQGHPRPWPVAKLRTFGDPAPKVQGTYAVRGVPGYSLAFSHIRSASILPPPAAPLLGRSVIKSRVSGKASHTAFAASAPR